MTRFEVMQKVLSQREFEQYIKNLYLTEVQEIAKMHNKYVYGFLYRDNKFKEHNSAQILDESYTWEHSNEGHEYWSEIQVYLEEKYPR